MAKSRLLSFAFSLAAFPLLAQSPGGGSPAGYAVPIPPTLKVFDPSFIDRNANACSDFFAFANGAWLKRDTIPAAFSSSGVSKDMTDRNELVVRAVLDDAMRTRHSLPPGSTQAKLGNYYASCMDSARAEREGISPIQGELRRISAVQSRGDLIREIGSLQKMGVDVAFRFFPQADPKDAVHYMAWTYQGGLGMPDRDYYTNTDAASDSLRMKYVAHVARSLALSGETTAQADADARRVMILETELAKSSMTRVALRDPNATYHKTSAAALSELAPAVDWPVYFKTVGLTSAVPFVNVGQPDFMKRVSMLMQTTPLEDWRAYLRYQLISSASPWLSSRFAQEDFTYGALFSGAKEMLPRWKRCLRVTDGQLGEALGQAYVAKTFSPAAKAEAKQVIDDIRSSFHDRLLKLTWMSDSTRKTFDAGGDMASNYGSLGGSWAGHELTHGFDDEGRRYDATGNLRDWWTALDSARFTEQANRIVQQFSGYRQVDTVHVNGPLTLGENLADFGGLLIAYDALERALTRSGKREVVDGYTPEQRFFIAFAQSWRSHTRPERLRSRAKTDPHAPAEWRTNGPVSNMPQFAQAFGCKAADPMVRSSDVVPKIW